RLRNRIGEAYGDLHYRLHVHLRGEAEEQGLCIQFQHGLPVELDIDARSHPPGQVKRRGYDVELSVVIDDVEVVDKSQLLPVDIDLVRVVEGWLEGVER